MPALCPLLSHCFNVKFLVTLAWCVRELVWHWRRAEPRGAAQCGDAPVVKCAAQQVPSAIATITSQRAAQVLIYHCLTRRIAVSVVMAHQSGRPYLSAVRICCAAPRTCLPLLMTPPPLTHA